MCRVTFQSPVVQHGKRDSPPSRGLPTGRGHQRSPSVNTTRAPSRRHWDIDAVTCCPPNHRRRFARAHVCELPAAITTWCKELLPSPVPVHQRQEAAHRGLDSPNSCSAFVSSRRSTP
ncbi:hypothetical protein V5799_019917 [Amblyomma americanum]|uniref:Uncharacterized protein n=1 Tax=Amblyomma americanum TaxID=6943 RepID=A0AAQ4EV60_AMBAM